MSLCVSECYDGLDTPVGIARPLAMRLNQDQIAAIRASALEVFGAEARVWLFGSRVDDNRRGGDIDLLIRPAPACTSSLLARKIRLLGKLERQLGERRIDVIIETDNDPRPIVQVAHETGVRL